MSIARLTTQPIAVGRHLHRHERAIPVGVVAGEGHRALEEVGAVLRLHAGPLADANGVLDLLVAGLDRQRDDHLVDHLPHQDLLELVECADRLSGRAPRSSRE